MSQTPALSIALSDNERTRPIIQGLVRCQGVDLTPIVLHPSEMFWRQLKYAEFDISELSLSSLFIATAKGDRRWVALPIYTSRRFFHTNIRVRADRNIVSPADLKGKRVGVPEYQQTAALWTRGILQDEFGVSPRDIEWFMERGPDRSHGGATGFQPPEGVRLNQIPASTDIGQMLVKGELDATIWYIRASNLVDRSSIDLDRQDAVRRLFPNPLEEGRRYFRKTGIYPINHTLVIRRELHERHPWLALNLCDAFNRAKELAESEARQTLNDYVATGLMDVDAAGAFSADPKSYGMKGARPVIDTIARYVHEQGLTDRLVSVDELFAPSTMDL